MSIFSQVGLRKPKSSTFNLSYDRKFSLKPGYLVPCHVQEIVPGDQISMNTEQMLRLAPMVAPVMHEMNVFVHYYFVPNRLMWENWENFITGGERGDDDSVFPVLRQEVRRPTVEASSLADYLGLPLNLPGSIGLYPDVSILPFVAYQMIYNEYYRDQNLSDPVNLEILDGVNDWDARADLLKLQKRAWQHDYFTSALPFAQKGGDVTLPVHGSADIYYTHVDGKRSQYIRKSNDGEMRPGGYDLAGEMELSGITRLTDNDDRDSVHLDVSETHKVDLESGTSGTINDLRRAFRIQEWLEKNARAGSRYVESILSHFGVRSSDARLQRPEFLGGTMSPIMISEVLQTSETELTPQGNMAGHGVNFGKGKGFSKFFEEHGYLMAIVSVMPKTSYQQGIPRHFSKFDKFDYFWPEFQHIGEQEIKQKELMALGYGDNDPEEVFGYIPRYSEYKYNPSTVHGDFKLTLDFWHLGRIFSYTNPPKLNDAFIECEPSNRIFAVEDSDEDNIYCHMFHNIRAKRKMAYFGDPSFRL